MKGLPLAVKLIIACVICLGVAALVVLSFRAIF